MSSKADPRYRDGKPAVTGHSAGTLKDGEPYSNPEAGRVPVTRRQEMVGSHRVGQDIEKRGEGKLAPENASRVKGLVSKKHPNFSRARVVGVPIDSEDFVRGLKENEKDAKTAEAARSFVQSQKPPR